MVTEKIEVFIGTLDDTGVSRCEWVEKVRGQGHMTRKLQFVVTQSKWNRTESQGSRSYGCSLDGS